MDVLSGRYYKNYNKVSRYSSLPYFYHELDGKYVYSTSAHLNRNAPYTLDYIKDGDTLDSLALYYYNNPTYYWAIAEFNDIDDPFEKLEVGREIRIPSFSSLALDI